MGADAAEPRVHARGPVLRDEGQQPAARRPATTPASPTPRFFAALERAGVSNRYFFNDVPVSALWGAPGLARSGSVAEYYARCASGTLPNVSYVDPNFAAAWGRARALRLTKHPHGDVRAGQAFMSDVVHAFMESPQWERGALFIVYDEWGGFFDHVAAPRVIDDRNSSNLDDDYGQMGPSGSIGRDLPLLRAAMWTTATYGFESILQMIEYRFGLARSTSATPTPQHRPLLRLDLRPPPRPARSARPADRAERALAPAAPERRPTSSAPTSTR